MIHSARPKTLIFPNLYVKLRFTASILFRVVSIRSIGERSLERMRLTSSWADL